MKTRVSCGKEGHKSLEFKEGGEVYCSVSELTAEIALQGGVSDLVKDFKLFVLSVLFNDYLNFYGYIASVTDGRRTIPLSQIFVLIGRYKLNYFL
jgi:hypothetical protein